jgi:cyanate lyase
MTTTEKEVTAAQVLNEMRADAEMMETVAEMLSMNREAVVKLAQGVAKREAPNVELSTGAAHHMASFMVEILKAFAHDIREAIEHAESGKKKVHVVDMSDDSTKH